ncbi:restriction endonuclease subunit S [Mycoplasmopsis hyopharyngis]|uniref:restriction endonuclease subunit S n=1 Tax=Mycoplasmopsis hyopharyngis TaxID=29558 RepID=UPI0038739778
MKPNNSIILSEYLNYFFHSNTGKISINTRIKGAAQPCLFLNDLKDIDIFVPDLQKQHHIVNTIGSVDDLIEKNNELIKKIKNFRKLYFSNFSKICDRSDEILNHIKFKNGSQPPKKFHTYENKNGYIRFIQNRDYSNDNNLTYIPISNKNSICEKTDIMIDKYGEAGKIRYGLNGAYNVALAKIIPYNKYEKEFIRDFLTQENLEKLLFSSSKASTRSSLNETCFKGIKFPILNEYQLKKYEFLMHNLLIIELKIQEKNKKLIIIKQNLLEKYF